MCGKSLAVITARGGSKRIPRKNIKEFLGFPIIKYSIEAALGTSCFDEVMVSTDDKEIAEVSISFGAKAPFFRSEATSNDYAMTADVIQEVIIEYKKRGMCFDYCCCIYPTAPFVTPQRLLEGYDLLRERNADSVIPVARFSYPIQRAFKIENGRLAMMWPENISARSQDLEPTFHDCGQFYWLEVKSFLRQKSLYAENTIPLEIPEHEAQDIDTEEDWKIAEMKYRFLNNPDYLDS
jgi:N-acylneuraminate cytidylyltransferase